MHHRADAIAAVGGAVRARRKDLGLTQGETAELAGVAVRTVHAVEAGKATVRLDALLAVLSAVGLQLRLERGNALAALVAAERPL
jgi:y4mF family transcriptional regulator